MKRLEYNNGNVVNTEHGITTVVNSAFGKYQVVGIKGRTIWADKIEPVKLRTYNQMTQPRYKSILLQVLKSICTEKLHFKLRAYKELSDHIEIDVQLNKAMFISDKLYKDPETFKAGLKRLVKAISDWAKQAKL